MHLFAADAAVLLDPVERVVHQASVAAHVVCVAVHELLQRRSNNKKTCQRLSGVPRMGHTLNS